MCVCGVWGVRGIMWVHVIPRPREVLTLSSVLFDQALAVIKHTHWQEVNDNTHAHTVLQLSLCYSVTVGGCSQIWLPSIVWFCQCFFTVTDWLTVMLSCWWGWLDLDVRVSPPKTKVHGKTVLGLELWFHPAAQKNWVPNRRTSLQKRLSIWIMNGCLVLPHLRKYRLQIKE